MPPRIPKLYIGRLPWTIGSKELREYFSQFGYVRSSVVVFDKGTGFSKGYGFVQYGNRDSFVDATRKQSHIIEGQSVFVQQAQG